MSSSRLIGSSLLSVKGKADVPVDTGLNTDPAPPNRGVCGLERLDTLRVLEPERERVDQLLGGIVVEVACTERRRPRVEQPVDELTRLLAVLDDDVYGPFEQCNLDPGV